MGIQNRSTHGTGWYGLISLPLAVPSVHLVLHCALLTICVVFCARSQLRVRHSEDLFFGQISSRLYRLRTWKYGQVCVPFLLHCLVPHPNQLFFSDNGGDGLVAARHLYHFGYQVSVYYPKRSKNLEHMLHQLTSISVAILDAMPSASEIDEKFDFFVDAIFGFSFAGDIRAPFDSIIDELHKIKVPTVAIDVPSGWDVDKGNVSGKGLTAETLISLTAPKLCATQFKGKYHWLGGRFVPKEAAEAYNLVLPSFPGCEQCVLLDPSQCTL